MQADEIISGGATRTELDPDQILAELSRARFRFPEKALRAAGAWREELAPRLIEALRREIERVREGKKPEGSLSFYAVFLLAAFRATEAVPVLLGLLRLSDDQCDELIGDAEFEYLPKTLAVLCERPEELAPVIKDRSVSEAGRGICTTAYVEMVRLGRISMEEGVRRLRQHLRDALEQGDAGPVTPLVDELTSLDPRDALEEIHEAFARGMVDDSYICLEDVARAMAKARGREGAGVTESCQAPTVDEIVEELRTWYWAEDDQDDEPADDPPGPGFAELDVEEIIAELDRAHRHLPEEALRAAQLRRQEITPKLIEVLQRVVDLARNGIEYEGNAPFFAVFLLAEFRAAEALPVIFRLLELPDDQRDRVFGDADCECLSRLLAAVVDDVDLLDSAMRNPDLEHIARWVLASAYVKMVAAGRLSSGEAVRRLRAHLRESMDRGDIQNATALISELSDLAAGEALPDIREAFERGLVDETTITLDYLEQCVAEAEGTAAGVQPHQIASLYVEDTVEELRTWCWPEDDEDDSEWGGEDDEGPGPYHGPLTGSSRSELHDIDDDFELLPASLEPFQRETPRIGRNDPCPCGSGKKFKKCCLRRQ